MFRFTTNENYDYSFHYANMKGIKNKEEYVKEDYFFSLVNKSISWYFISEILNFISFLHITLYARKVFNRLKTKYEFNRNFIIIIVYEFYIFVYFLNFSF